VAGYRKHLRQRQRRAHRALVEALGSPRWPAIRRELDALLTRALEMPLATTDPTIRDAGSAMLDRMLARVLRAGERARADDDPARLHRLRIGAKRLRYFLEYVVPVSGPEVVAGIQALSRLQDILGEHQDACVARQSLLDYRDLARLSGWERKALRRLVQAETANVAAARTAFRAEWPDFVTASHALVLC
jgi:CHAD domain-containing protein